MYRNETAFALGENSLQSFSLCSNLSLRASAKHAGAVNSLVNLVSHGQRQAFVRRLCCKVANQGTHQQSPHCSCHNLSSTTPHSCSCILRTSMLCHRSPGCTAFCCTHFSNADAGHLSAPLLCSFPHTLFSCFLSLHIPLFTVVPDYLSRLSCTVLGGKEYCACIRCDMTRFSSFVATRYQEMRFARPCSIRRGMPQILLFVTTRSSL